MHAWLVHCVSSIGMYFHGYRCYKYSTHFLTQSLYLKCLCLSLPSKINRQKDGLTHRTSSHWFISQMFAMAGTGWIRSMVLNLDLPHGWRDTSTWATNCYLLGCALAGNWNQKWGQDLNPVTQDTAGGYLMWYLRHYCIKHLFFL